MDRNFTNRRGSSPLSKRREGSLQKSKKVTQDHESPTTYV